VLRFSVTEVDDNIDGVVATIADALSRFHLQAPHLPPALRVEDESSRERLDYSRTGQVRSGSRRAAPRCSASGS
jgi:hypothetical protein